MSEEKKMPVLKLRNGGLSIAVFAENRKREDNTEYVSYSPVIQKSWKDKDGNWQQQSISLFENQFADLMQLMIAMTSELLKLRNGIAQTQAPAPAQQEPAKAEPEVRVVDIDDIDKIPF